MPWFPSVFNERTRKIPKDQLRGGEQVARTLRLGGFPTPVAHHGYNTPFGVVEKGCNQRGRGYGVV
eukprot:1179544-Rhodomonas_salina.1